MRVRGRGWRGASRSTDAELSCEGVSAAHLPFYFTRSSDLYLHEARRCAKVAGSVEVEGDHLVQWRRIEHHRPAHALLARRHRKLLVHRLGKLRDGRVERLGTGGRGGRGGERCVPRAVPESPKLAFCSLATFPTSLPPPSFCLSWCTGATDPASIASCAISARHDSMACGAGERAEVVVAVVVVGDVACVDNPPPHP